VARALRDARAWRFEPRARGCYRPTVPGDVLSEPVTYVAIGSEEPLRFTSGDEFTERTAFFRAVLAAPPGGIVVMQTDFGPEPVWPLVEEALPS
jgi:hypothetical protein